jgi:hypothetical protein
MHMVPVLQEHLDVLPPILGQFGSRITSHPRALHSPAVKGASLPPVTIGGRRTICAPKTKSDGSVIVKALRKMAATRRDIIDSLPLCWLIIGYR